MPGRPMTHRLLRKRRIFNPESWKIVTVPNILTFVRVGIVPFLVLAFFIPGFLGTILTLALFLVASLTDYADGYIARRFQQASPFGAFLDPIADKILVAATLLMMAGTGRIVGIHLLPAVAIVCREFIISGLREFLAAANEELQVSRLAKWKTFTQIAAIAVLLAGPPAALFYAGTILLWIAAFLAIITGATYLKISWVYVKVTHMGQR